MNIPKEDLELLTPFERKILAYFLNHPNEIQCAARLTEILDVNQNALSKHLHYLVDSDYLEYASRNKSTVYFRLNHKRESLSELT